MEIPTRIPKFYAGFVSEVAYAAGILHSLGPRRELCQ